jgi:hypothetical protein
LDLLHLICSQFGTTGNTALSLIYTFRFTVTHALRFSVFTSRILATDLQQSHCHLKSHMKSSSRSVVPFLPLLSTQFNSKLISRQAGVSKLDSSLQSTTLFYVAEHFLITTLHGPAVNTASIVKVACLLMRCPVIDVLLLSEFACAGMCLPSRCLAMSMHVTV